MTNAAPERPSPRADWAVFYAGELVTCPNTRETRERHRVSCGEKDIAGEVKVGTVIYVRVLNGRVVSDLPGTLRKCPRCKTMLEVVRQPDAQRAG
jgi:ribosomal protein L32